MLKQEQLATQHSEAVQRIDDIVKKANDVAMKKLESANNLVKEVKAGHFPV